MKLNKLVSFVVVIILFSFKINAQTIPVEMQLIIESFSQVALSEPEITNIKKQLVKIDQNLAYIPEDSSIILIKNEIYKRILLASDSNKSDNYHLQFTSQNLLESKEKFTKEKNSLTPFWNWMLEAIFIDIDKLTNKSSLEQIIKSPDQKLKDKLTLLLFFPARFNVLSVDEFNNEFKSLGTILIDSIYSQTSILVNFSELNLNTNIKKSNTLELLFTQAIKNNLLKNTTKENIKNPVDTEIIKTLTVPTPNELDLDKTEKKPKTSWIPEEEPIIQIDSSILKKMEDKNFDWNPKEVDEE